MKVVYQAIDGSIFESLEECQNYEKQAPRLFDENGNQLSVIDRDEYPSFIDVSTQDKLDMYNNTDGSDLPYLTNCGWYAYDNDSDRWYNKDTIDRLHDELNMVIKKAGE